MAATSVTALYATNPRSSRDGSREYQAVYRVLTDSSNDGPITARDATGVPVVNTAFSFGTDYDYGAFASEYSVALEASPSDHKRQWLVTVNYTSEPIRRGDDQYLDDPLDEPVVISGSFVSGRKPVTSDRNSAPVDNSAGDQFEGLEQDDSNMSLVIQKNFATWDLSTQVDYIDSVNSATFFTLSARKWKLTNIRTSQLFRGSTTPYYQVTFEFLSNKNTWDFKPADRGWYYKSGSDKLLFVDKNGLPLNAPGNLNGSGAQLGSTANIVYFDGAGGNPSAFRVYAEKDFASLNIPTSDPTIT